MILRLKYQIQQAYNLESYAFLENLNKYSVAVKSAASVKYLSFILSKVIHKLYLSPLPVVFKIYCVGNIRKTAKILLIPVI